MLVSNGLDLLHCFVCGDGFYINVWCLHSCSLGRNIWLNMYSDIFEVMLTRCLVLGVTSWCN